MTTKALKLRIKNKIKNLPFPDDKATNELLKIPEIERELKQAEVSIKVGKGVDWRSVRNDV